MIKVMQSQIKALTKQVNALTGMTIEGYNRTSSRGGIVFGLGDKKPVAFFVRDKDVVIVRKPIAGDRTLLVREAKYADIPPSPCVTTNEVTTCYYEWRGGDFEAYPPLGLEAADFEGDEWDGTKQPALDTVYHEVRRKGEVWVLRSPSREGTAARPVRIVNALTPTAKVATVVEIYTLEDGTLADKKKEDGVTLDTFVAKLWYNCVGKNYQRFYGRTPQVVLSCFFVEGDWRLFMDDRFILGSPSASFSAGRCNTG